ncbi:MAG: hypothetical protein IT377_15240 [Polyangiaceae bacterium]|nr:hypothetical protein [Polyangiaceae bacterium]
MKLGVCALSALLALSFAQPAAGVLRGTGKGGLAYDHHSFEYRALDFDAVPWQEPSEKHPWGTVRLGAFRVDAEFQPAGKACVLEWDLFDNRIVTEIELGGAAGSHTIRVARGAGGMVAVVGSSTDHAVRTELVFLDERDRVRKVVDLGQVTHPGLAAEGDLVAVTTLGLEAELKTFRLSTGEPIAKRVLPVRGSGPVVPPLWEPLHDVAVRGGEVFVLSTWFEDSRLERLSPRLGRRGLYARHEGFTHTARSFAPQQDRLSVSEQGVWVAWNDRVERLSPGLVRQERVDFGVPRSDEAPAPRISVDARSGRVATDDGRLAARFGAEWVAVVELGREVWHATDEVELRQDRVKGVVWAFGRVVIVRDAPGVGVTVIEPF